MRRTALTLASVIALTILVAPPVARAETTVTDVMDLARAGLSDAVILSQIEQNIKNAVGVGEAGLDHFHCKTDAGRARQIEVFKKVVEIAETVDKPLVIHGRDAEYEALQLVRHLDNVVFHCYGGSLETMNQITDAGYYVSIPTLVCFSKHHQSLAKHLPLKRMVIETDSPYLSPRKGRNEPAFLVDSVATIAKLRGMEEVRGRHPDRKRRSPAH